jgi:UDP-N-acetylglucosamine--N-acetylmuramyl-(pentapeptide) pyrophosphoryl-undecaprenol N-acetylglucosamine transferase
MIADRSAEDTLVTEALALLKNTARAEAFAENIGKMALRDSDEIIATEVLKLAGRIV